MAKLTIEEAKVKLEPIENAIKALQGMGVAIPASLQAEFDKFTKIITGNSSENLATTFNEKLAVQINAHPEFVELLAGQIGTRARLTVVVKTAEDGSKSIAFESGSGSTGGGQKAGTSVGGGTKAGTAYNNYKVTVLATDATAGYEAKEGTFSTAAGAVQFLLNGGKNPFNLGAEWQKGNSMVRALIGTNGNNGLNAHEAFAANFTLECSRVEVAKKEVETPAAETPAAE